LSGGKSIHWLRRFVAEPPNEAAKAYAGTWAAAETAFFLTRRRSYNKLNVLNPKCPEGDVQERVAQFMSLKGIIDLEDFLSGWFMDAPFQDLRRENVLDFIAYGFWCGLEDTCWHVTVELYRDQPNSSVSLVLLQQRFQKIPSRPSDITQPVGCSSNDSVIRREIVRQPSQGGNEEWHDMPPEAAFVTEFCGAHSGIKWETIV
jgi:hypothetical protein